MTAMTPEEIGQSYDRITARWEDPEHPLTGIPQHERALRFLDTKEHALDVGCGCNGRLIDLMESAGLAVEGVDISERMIDLARRRNPSATFHHADIGQWPLPRRYDLISGWDSIWHVALADQEPLLRKLCAGLKPRGVLIFTMGGLDRPSEDRNSHMGVPVSYASLGIPRTLAVLAECGCVCRHLEYDQYPEAHVYVIAQRADPPASESRRPS
ncbi:MAG: class I SAM-dependent methyltransferase [Planctomycetota bacterium]